MFETTVIESKRKHFSARRAFVLPVSIGLHGLAIAASAVAALATVDFPINPPAQFAEYHLAEPPPPPPPPPAPPKTIKPIVQPEIRIPDLELAPTVIPDTIPDIPLEAEVVEGAVEGGVEGGVAGGLLGGVPGGISGSVPPPEPPPAEPEGPLRVGGEVKSPEVIDSPAPEYPPTAVRARLNGTVLVELIVDERGVVTRVNVVESSDPIFEAAALLAVKKWKFRPGTQHGEKVETIFKLRVNFEMAKRWR